MDRKQEQTPRQKLGVTVAAGLRYGLCTLLLSSAVCGRAPAPAGIGVAAVRASSDSSGDSAKAVAGPVAAAPEAPFTDGERVFRSVLETLRSKYYRPGLTDDELYRAATAGLLSKLEPQMSAWNRLLTPEEMRDMHSDLKGDIVGIGVEIHFDDDSGISDVLSVIPGSPAEQAGLRDGDKILTVAGKSYKGKELRNVVSDLRGQAGEIVALTLLRDGEVHSFQIRRQRVAYDVVKTLLLPGDVGYLLIHQFTDKTAEAVATGLAELRSKRARALVIDLRGNQGGLFQSALATAELFLKKGTPIVKLRHRGGREELLLTKQGLASPPWPVVLLIDHDTASSGELLAGALREGLGAQLVGQKTLGKGSIQELEELPNHYAIKYTISVFMLPSGAAVDGQGLTPDIDVPLPVPAPSSYDRQLARLQRMAEPTARLASDLQLHAAVNILRLQLH